MIRPEALFTPVSERATLDEPLKHLMACHRRIEERLGMMERGAEALETAREAALGAFRSAFAFLDTSGALHTADEEESLFPRLRPLMEMGERTYLAGLEHDHTEAHRMYADLKGLMGAPLETREWVERVRGLVERLVAHYRRHIASEDEVLQGYGRELLDAGALAEIAAEMRARRG